MIGNESITGSIGETENLKGSLTNANSLDGSVNNSGTLIQEYTLPVASANTLGGIKVGANLSIDADGTLNASASGDGTSNYSDLTNKPKINNIELTGNKTLDQLGIQAKGDYAKPSDIPTKTSQLTNDSNFLVSIPTEYITEAELNEKGYLTEHQDISNLAKKSELHSHSNKSVLDNITSAKVTSWDNKSTFSGNYNDLSNKPNIPTVPTNISAFTNDSGYLTSKLKGKKITVVGDSLSTGYTVGKNWVNMLAERTGAIVTNLATDGATIAYRDDDNGNNFISKLSLIPTDSEYIVFMGGGNDMMKSVVAGTKNDKDKVKTTCGAVFQTIAYCQQNIPRAKVMYITEPPIGAEIHDAYDPYLNIIMEICEMGHIPCFNMHSNFGLNPNIPQIRQIYWLDDYVHLTEEGQQYMSQKIQNFLENEVVNNNKNANSLNGYKLSILSASEYASLSSKDTNTIYITKDNKAYLGSLLILGGGTSSGGDSGDTPNEGAIDQTLWDTFFKINTYVSAEYNTVTNSNPILLFEGTATGSKITNLSEENAIYSYGAAITHVATTLDAGKTITVNFDLEATNVKIHNMGFYYNGGQFGTMVQTNGQNGNYTVSISNTTGATVDINGIGMMVEPNDATGYTLKMTIKSVTIA